MNRLTSLWHTSHAFKASSFEKKKQKKGKVFLD